MGSITASTMGRPTLPQATVRRPPARSIASSICTVVVLPFVPVTASHGAGCSGSRSRQASSTSPQTGIPRSTAWASNGAEGDQPGEVTTRSTSSGSSAVEPGPRRTVGTQDLQQGGLLATVARLGLVEGGHPRAEVGQVVRRGEAGDTHARDDGTDTAPVAGATESVDRVGHTPATHSA